MRNAHRPSLRITAERPDGSSSFPPHSLSASGSAWERRAEDRLERLGEIAGRRSHLAAQIPLMLDANRVEFVVKPENVVADPDLCRRNSHPHQCRASKFQASELPRPRDREELTLDVSGVRACFLNPPT